MTLVHEHFMGRFEIKKPPTKACGFYMETWFRRLIKHIGMELLNGPHLTYLDEEGNRGWTGVAIIKTSHIALHVWDELDPAIMQFDCYSCAPMDPQRVLNMLEEFDPIRADWWFVDRNKAPKLIRGGGQFTGNDTSTGQYSGL